MLVEQTAARVFHARDGRRRVRTLDDIRALLNAGADKVSINTAAVQRPEFVREAAQKFGTQCIVVAIDAKRSPTPGQWEVFTHGGRKSTGLDAVEWAKRMEAYGAGEILLTSMDQDGQQSGYDLGLTAAVSETVSIPVIASGGVGTLEHLYDGFTKGRPTRCWRRRFFISGRIRFHRPKNIYARKAYRSGSIKSYRLRDIMGQGGGAQGVKFDGQGLIPAVVQDWLDGTVLMVGYMNQDALNQTVATKTVHFWSRSRQKLWEKGETSGNKLLVKTLFVDCDRDTFS